MYDPKFEKGVRQKMEGLEFTPSESVWANIQKAVAARGRRRGGLFFWRFSLPAVLLAGLMSVAYFAATRHPATAPPSIQGRNGASDPATSAQAAASSPKVTRDATPDRAVTGIRTRSAARRFATGEGNGSGDASGDADRSLNLVASAKDATGRNRTDMATSATGRTSEGTTAEGTISEGTISEGTTAESAGAATANARIAPYLYQPALAGQRNAAAIKAAAPSTKKGIISLGRLDKATRPWEAGFTAGGGVSRLNRLNISATTQDQSLSANLYNIATTAAAPSKTYVSDVRPDASFTAGIYLQKPLSRRWSVNLGMNLHYYSTRITIGQQVNTYVPATASLIAPNVTQAAQTSTAFIAGDRQVFTNHYYFLELPVNVQYQLNKSHLLPLFLEGGVSLSRLMGSDALFYNAHSGTYYKDPTVLEKTQFNVSSALMVGLPFHGIRILAGPQVEYGLTPLVNNHSQGDQHFLYGGLRIVVIPGRK